MTDFNNKNDPRGDQNKSSTQKHQYKIGDYVDIQANITYRWEVGVVAGIQWTTTAEQKIRVAKYKDTDIAQAANTLQAIQSTKRYFQTLKANSSRIKPFRTYTHLDIDAVPNNVGLEDKFDVNLATIKRIIEWVSTGCQQWPFPYEIEENNKRETPTNQLDSFIDPPQLEIPTQPIPFNDIDRLEAFQQNIRGKLHSFIRHLYTRQIYDTTKSLFQAIKLTSKYLHLAASSLNRFDCTFRVYYGILANQQDKIEPNKSNQNQPPKLDNLANLVGKCKEQAASNLNTVDMLTQGNYTHLNCLAVAEAYNCKEIMVTLKTIIDATFRDSSFLSLNHDVLSNLSKEGNEDDIAEAIRSLIEQLIIEADLCQAVQKLTLKGLLESKLLIPFDFLLLAANLYDALFGQFLNEDNKQAIQIFMRVYDINFARLTNEHLRELDFDLLLRCINSIVDLEEEENTREIKENWSLIQELNLGKVLVACPFFQRKQQGINLLNNAWLHDRDLFALGVFRNWMDDVGLLTTLFVQNDNPEIIRKSTELIKTLFIQNVTRESDFQLIWNSLENKHQASLKEIYRFFGDLPGVATCPTDELQMIFGVLSSKPRADEGYLQMLVNFTINSLNSPHDELTSGYGLTILYEAYLDARTSLESLMRILNELKDTHVFDMLLNTVIKSFLEGKKPKQHLLILNEAKENGFLEAHTFGKDFFAAIFKLIGGLEASQGQYDKFISLCVKMIDDLEESIAIELFYLWQGLTEKSRVAFERCLLQTARQKERTNLMVLLKTVAQQEIFLQLVSHTSDQQLAHLSFTSYKIIIFLFKEVNISNHKFLYTGQLYRQIALPIIGEQLLWKLLINSKVAAVISAVAHQLAAIYTSQNQSSQVVDTLIANFHQKIMHQLSASSIETQFSSRVANIQQVLLRALSYQTFDYRKQFKPLQYSQAILIIAVGEPPQWKKLNFNILDCFINLQYQAAKLLNVPSNCIQLYAKDHPLGRQSFFRVILPSKLKTFKVQIVSPRFCPIGAAFQNSIDFFLGILTKHGFNKDTWSIIKKLPTPKQLTQDINNHRYKLSDNLYRDLLFLNKIYFLTDDWWLKFLDCDAIQLINQVLAKLNSMPNFQLYLVGKVISSLLKAEEISTNLTLSVMTETLNSVKRVFTLLSSKEALSNQIVNRCALKLLEDAGRVIFAEKYFHELLKHKDATQLLTQMLVEFLPYKAHQAHFAISFVKAFKCYSIPSQKNETFRLYSTRLDDVCLLARHGHTAPYFELLEVCLSDDFVAETAQQETQISNHLKKLLQDLPEESHRSIPNLIASSLLNLLEPLIKFQSAQSNDQYSQKLLMYYILNLKRPIFQSERTLKAGFKNLAAIDRKHPKLKKRHLNFFRGIIHGAKWRGRDSEDWSVLYSQKWKSQCGFVGIRNLGCICYMNSFIQQLYAVPIFRQCLLLFNENIDCERMLFQLRRMFLHLTLADTRAFNPEKFGQSIKDSEGKSVNVRQQMDIDEFAGKFFDKLEAELAKSPVARLVKDTFGGSYANQIVCKGCPHYSCTEEDFLSISVEVKGKKNLHESLETMIRGDFLDGDNAYFCSTCAKPVAAVKRTSLKHLPDELIVTLKRFEFDFEQMAKLKIHTYFQFPQKLSLKQYTQQFLRQKEGVAQGCDVEPESFYEYELRGVVIHQGSSESGHYYSLIKNRKADGQWAQFNDSIVRSFDSAKLGEQAFGGCGFDKRIKTNSAYMLFYERTNLKRAEVSIFQFPKLKETLMAAEINKQVLKEVQNEKRRNYIERVLFSNQFDQYVRNTAGDGETESLQLLMLHYLTITIRMRGDTKSYEALANFIDPLFSKKHPTQLDWLVEALADTQIYDQLFIYSQNNDQRKLIANWIAELLLLVSPAKAVEYLQFLHQRIKADRINNLPTSIILCQLAQKDQKWLQFIIKAGFCSTMTKNMFKSPKIRDKWSEEEAAQSLSVYSQESTEALSLNQISNQPSETPAQVENSSSEKLIDFSTQLLCQDQSTLPYWKQLVNLSGKSASKYLMRNVFQGPVPSFMNLRKWRQNSENAYVWRLFKIVLQSPEETQNLDPQNCLDNDYFRDFLTPQVVGFALSEYLNKSTLEQLTDFLAALSIGDDKYYKMLLGEVLSGLKVCQVRNYRHYFILYMKLIQLKPLGEAVEAMVTLLKYATDNGRSIFGFIAFVQWLIKLIVSCPVLAEFLRGQPQLVEKFISQFKKTPNKTYFSKNSFAPEHYFNRVYGLRVPSSPKAYNYYEATFKIFFLAVTDGSPLPRLFSCGRPIFIGNPCIGDNLLLFDSIQNKFIPVEVKSCVFGKVQVSSKTSLQFYDQEDQRLVFQLQKNEQDTIRLSEAEEDPQR